jgi:D-arginine dehydrogenase
MSRLVLLEQERYVGFHSSGRNAAMVRRFVTDEALLPLTMQGAEFIRTAHERWPHGAVFQPGGSLFTAAGEGWSILEKQLEIARRAGLEAEVWSPDKLAKRVAATRGGRFDGAVYTPDDGTVDVHRLLHGYLKEARAAGTRVFLSARVSSVSVDSQLRIRSVTAGDLEIATPRVVNAAGAWSSQIARLAGASPIILAAYRRHLVYTGPYRDARPDWPYVWDLDHDIYFRPESGGLLLSPCDHALAEPGIPDTSPDAIELLGRKLHRAFPALAEIPVARSWAGLRVFAPDGRFVVGEDPRVAGFYWATGLGGHGVTTSAAVGALVAGEIVDTGSTPPPHPFRPDRF